MGEEPPHPPPTPHFEKKKNQIERKGKVKKARGCKEDRMLCRKC